MPPVSLVRVDLASRENQWVVVVEATDRHPSLLSRTELKRGQEERLKAKSRTWMNQADSASGPQN